MECDREYNGECDGRIPFLFTPDDPNLAAAYGWIDLSKVTDPEDDILDAEIIE